MIRVEGITIREFRGIRDLALDLRGKNFAVSGPNGSGKSGVVDALEFVLTGSVSRLTGRGRGDLSLKDHAPHVDASLEHAYVEAILVLTESGAKFTVRRAVKLPRSPIITPDTPEARAALDNLENHPEVALSRREIIKYVLAEPGQRAKDVQALLRLDELETLRGHFQRIAKSCDSIRQSADQERNTARQALLRALGITQAKPEDVLDAVNKRRAVLSLPALTDLNPSTSVRDGLIPGAGISAQRVAKAHAISDLSGLVTALEGLSSTETAAEFDRAFAALEALSADDTLLDGVVRDDMLRVALQLFDGDACPVCDTSFTLTDFQQKIAAKRERLKEGAAARASTEKLLPPISARFRDTQAKLRLCGAIGPKLDPQIDTSAVGAFLETLEGACRQIASFLPVEATVAAIKAARDGAASINPTLEALTLGVASLPEPSEQDAAKEFLIVADERLNAYRQALVALRAAEKRAATSRQVHELYVASTRDALEKIYAAVEVTFSSFYRELNSDDESSFQAKLTASSGKLGLDVDFYKRGFYPPGAFHSEGHQDSMGLCLYLALLRHLLGSKFQLAVLDDVLMSVDADHRREVCRLLLTHFPDTQFILTTHDEVWLRHMKTAGLIDSKGAMQFRDWTVDRGPSVWNADVWVEIAEKLALNDVGSSARLLRNYFEYLAREYCQDLRAKVEFQADGRYDLGGLLYPAIGRMNDLLKEARLAAESWADTDRVTKIKLFEATFSSAVQAVNVEQWQVNPAIHFNDWANLHKSDFEPVVAAYRTLANAFTCPTCSSGLSVSPPKGTKEFLQCRCGQISFGFSKKPAAKASGSASA